MRLTHNNHEQVMQLFNSYWQGRIERMNNQIMGERATNPVFLGGAHTLEGLQLAPGQETPDTRIIDLPEGAREALITFERELFARGNGMANASDGDRRRELVWSILRDIPVQDRQAAVHTMNTIGLEEGRRLHAAAQQAVPTWIAGQRLPADVLSPILNGHGGNVNVTA